MTTTRILKQLLWLVVIVVVVICVLVYIEGRHDQRVEYRDCLNESIYGGNGSPGDC